MTNTWSIALWTGSMGIALLATKVDLFIVIFILIFFWVVHGIILYENEKNESNVFNIIDFLFWIIVSIATGIMFINFWILSGMGEFYIYMSAMVGSLLWIRWIDLIVRLFTKKLWKEISLLDKKTDNESDQS